jgi:sigma-B regulation protein RsbU (phosphoserine phosphatase)
VRSEALRTPYPSAVLAGLHEVLVRYHPEQFCTAVFATLDRTAEGARLTIASGGHHLPMRRRTGGHVDTIGEIGTILGMLDTPRLTDTTTILRPGDVIVLYTDGVTEARRDGEFLDDRGLLGAIAGAEELDAQELADAIVTEVLDFQQGDTRDDIAVVVIKVP